MIDAHTALIVVDMQNDFCDGGALAVAGGDEIVPIINRLGQRFANVVLTQDWHPAGHASFASTHARAPFEKVRLSYGEQTLWPDHCVQGTPGAELHPGLELPHAQALIRKGHRRDIDSYSAFVEADGRTPTGLGGYLRERTITRVIICGLATDFCVGWTAQDAARAGFEAVVIEEACRAIDVDGSLERAWAQMAGIGVKRVTSLPG